MEYIKGKPYFCSSKEQIKAYPYLKKDMKCDVLIIGAGIDGTVLNYYLSQKYDTILLDKSRIGYSCTSCATALLEYQLDEFAEDLIGIMSEKEIVLAYKIGLGSIRKIDELLESLGNHCEFSLRPTFLFTNSIFSKNKIEKEYLFRKKHGFKCKLFTEENNEFPFEIKAGIYAENGGCEFNPYLFTKQMVENAKNQNKIFENTNISELISQKDGGYIAKTNFGDIIFAKKVVIATGFNWELLGVDDLCERFMTYSIVTEPLAHFSWKEKALIHDASNPYHYIRWVADNRIIFGGEDTPFKEKPISEKKTNKIYDKLTEDLYSLFPQIKDYKIDYKFCGSFGTTSNNLGLIGESAINKDLLLFISCGANGIINAIAGVDIIIDAI